MPPDAGPPLRLAAEALVSPAIRSAKVLIRSEESRPSSPVSLPSGLIDWPNAPIFLRGSDHCLPSGRAERISLNSASVSDSRSEYIHGFSSATDHGLVSVPAAVFSRCRIVICRTDDLPEPQGPMSARTPDSLCSRTCWRSATACWAYCRRPSRSGASGLPSTGSSLKNLSPVIGSSCPTAHLCWCGTRAR